MSLSAEQRRHLRAGLGSNRVGGSIADFIDAITAENTDGQSEIALLAGFAGSGTWTKSVASGLVAVTRTAAAAMEDYWIELPVSGRTATSKGIKVTGLFVNYSVGTAAVNDVRFEVWKVTQGADGAARTAAVQFGQTNSHYDTAHDTAAERGEATGAPELNKAVVTAPSPAYLATGEALLLRVFVDGTATGVVAVTSAILLTSETRVDES